MKYAAGTTHIKDEYIPKAHRAVKSLYTVVLLLIKSNSG